MQVKEAVFTCGVLMTDTLTIIWPLNSIATGSVKEVVKNQL